MALFTKLIPLNPNSGQTNQAIAVLAEKQNRLFGKLSKHVVAGVTGTALAEIARQEAVDLDLTLAMRGRLGYPDDISVSVNDEILNGLPNGRELRDGDLVKISIATQDGSQAFCGQNWTFLVGQGDLPTEPGTLKQNLMSTALTCLNAGIAVSQPRGKLSTVLQHIREIVTAKGLFLSDRFAGHMIGAEPFMEPVFVSPGGLIAKDYQFCPGAMFSLLVLVHPAKPAFAIKDDQWTCYDRNKYPSAAYSHIVLMQEDGPEILTSAPEGSC